MKDMSPFMLELAHEYKNNKEMQENLDKVYGEGTTVYIGEVLEAFYK